ncbi:MAG: hypothetical protein AUJ74_06445 [Candidatus Omnitrophica bacterium CG1_02_44_16]|nr:MAG: hypothetical protein AUJ74_06445 [Candidatus Omnitrophica bacterium CG1_02_44_16]PIY83756.1 MAG: hypothetical protein COY78_00905 [Candidatus Omnitrophica bacterium CG_4_10_14_0_8_um_filter_44_12]PIZ83349.1 MAG: hypothetical protein COX96_08280 [Candidatus Omnitrophica bacterium CG_4_10_14_0_2_um_filter_44_9]
MPHISLLKFLLLVILLAFSAFFSGAETALFSLDSIKLRRIAQAGKSTSLILKLLENSMKCLTTILFGNTIVNIVISAIITSLLIDFFGNNGVSISIGVTTLILLLFGEVTPKTIAIHNNERLSYIFSFPLYFFGRLMSPFLFLSTMACDNIISFFGLNLKKEPTLTEEEFKTVMEIGHRNGVVGKNEKEMVVSILELTTTTAQDVMTPRMDIKAISDVWDRERAVSFAKQVKHSKLPVYKDYYDNIFGVIFTRELFLEEAKTPAGLIKPVMFVPETKKISELIMEFYRQKAKIAIVVDEHGGTSGLVTLEDVLAEIFGEIHDGAVAAENLIEPLGPKIFRVAGKAPIDKVNDDCDLSIAQGDYDTLAGFLLDKFGKIPQEGERIGTAEAVFTIEKVLGRRIKSVILEKK